MPFDLCPLPELLLGNLISFWLVILYTFLLIYLWELSRSLYPYWSLGVSFAVKFGEHLWHNNVYSSILGNFIMISLIISFPFSLFSLFSTTALFQGQLSSSLNYICKVPLPCKAVYSQSRGLGDGIFLKTVILPTTPLYWVFHYCSHVFISKSTLNVISLFKIIVYFLI